MNGMRNAVGEQLKEDRRKRVERLKKIIIIVFIFFLLLPSICCMALFIKMIGIEKRIDTIEKKSQQQLQMEEQELVVHAAPKETEKADDSKNNKKTTKKKTVPKEEVADDQTKIKGKKVYLTFDDGPSKNTEKILDILDEYKVKATFFVIGQTDDFSKKMYQRIHESGNTLAMHSYTHEYKKIYKSIGAYKKDITELSDLLYSVTGERPQYVRFPGGSSNTVSNINMKDVIRYVNKEGLKYFDWNVINGDATGKSLTEKQMINNVISGVKSYESSIVLMHDCAGKEMTVKTLPEVLKQLKKMKVNILPINDTTVPVQHVRVNNTN